MIDWRLVLLTFALFFIHTIAVKLLPISVSTIIFLIENIVLVYTVIRRRLDWFLYVSTIILSVTYDIPSFVDESLTYLPSLASLPFVGGYFYILLVVSFIPKILNIQKWKNIIRDSPWSLLAKFTIYFFISGILMGIATMLIEDNAFPFRIVMWGRQLTGIGMFSIFLAYYIYESYCNPKFQGNIKVILFSSLVGLIYSSLLGVLLGFSRSYGEGVAILAPLAFFYSTTIFLFLFYKEYRSIFKLLLFTLSAIAFYMQFTYSNVLGGKSWLVIIIIGLYIMYVLYKKNRAIFTISCVSIFLLILPIIMGYANKQKSEESNSSRKMVQVVMLLSIISDPDLYDVIPSSPKIRIEEFFNTTEEYIRHPYYAILGKGFGGGHRDYRNAYDSNESGQFTIEQFNNEYFVFTHETINEISLHSGLIGLLMFLLVLIKAIKYSVCSPWMIIGGIWFFFYWGYSLSLMSIGLPALIIGFGSIKEKSQYSNKQI